jgi:hypothetical protein
MLVEMEYRLGSPLIHMIELGHARVCEQLERFDVALWIGLVWEGLSREVA